MRRPRSRWAGVRLRVTASAAIVTALGAVIAATLFLDGLHESLEGSLLTAAQEQADTVDAQLRAGADPRAVSVSSKDDLIMQILDSAGAIVATDHPHVRVPLTSSPGRLQDAQVSGLPDTYAVYARSSIDGKLVLVGLSEEQVDQADRTAFLWVIGSAPIGLALLAWVVWLATGRALRPVEVMRREAEAITAQHLHQRLAEPSGHDEIPRLARTLNDMLDRIDAAQRVQRQFVSDASHELRSPLATLRQLGQVAQRHPEQSDHAAFVRDVLAEESRMEDLVQALLVLARLDDGGTLRADPVDLDDLVFAAATRLRSARPDIRVDVHGVSGGQVIGDPVLLHQVVWNLATNAARHAKTTVRMSVKEVGEVAEVIVEDDGTGIPKEDRERVFARFARLDEARTRDVGGAGLGLAIVAEVVEAMRGRITLDDSDLGGARFTVTWSAESS